jgi:hypothetical protein
VLLEYRFGGQSYRPMLGVCSQIVVLPRGCVYRWLCSDPELPSGEVSAEQHKFQIHLESWGKAFQVVRVVYQRNFLFLSAADE